MEKGQVLKGREFERYFMADIEIVDATIIDFIGEFYLIVRIDNEYHRVSFSLNGTMRSREKLVDYQEKMPAKKILSTKSKGYAVRLAETLASFGYIVETVFNGQLYSINLIEW